MAIRAPDGANNDTEKHITVQLLSSTNDNGCVTDDMMILNMIITTKPIFAQKCIFGGQKWPFLGQAS